MFKIVCNPFGGLGLTGGIVDIGGLYDCLIGIYQNKADPEILDKYSEMRRKKYQELTDPISQDNIRRLFDQDPDKAMENDEFLKLLKKNEGNVEAQKEFLMSSKALMYDFTQHYRGAQVNGTTGQEGKAGTVHVQEVPAIGAD